MIRFDLNVELSSFAGRLIYISRSWKQFNNNSASVFCHPVAVLDIDSNMLKHGVSEAKVILLAFFL